MVKANIGFSPFFTFEFPVRFFLMPVQNVKSRRKNLNFNHQEGELQYLPQISKTVGCFFCDC